MADSGIDLIGRVLPALLLVIGTPLAVYWWARRGRGRHGSGLRITERAAFGRNSWIAVVAIDGRRFLVSVGERGINLVSELDPAPEPAPGEASGLHGSSRDDLLPFKFSEGSEPTEGDERRPWMGLVRRLQRMTLRTEAKPIWRPFRDTPR